MTRMTLAKLIAAFWLPMGLTGAVDDRKSDRDLPAELKVLDHYVGVWNIEIIPQDQLAKGTAKAEWILDGRFVQQNVEMQSADGTRRANIIALMTYDPARKKYWRWAFVSDGITSEGEGVWDNAARKMTFVTRDRQIGSTMSVTSDFSVADIETWRVVNTDRAGNVLFERSGKNMRQK